MRHNITVRADRGGQSVGVYRYRVADNRWWWSDEIYQLHGFAPGEVVPSTELLLAHMHPEDKEYAAAALEQCLVHGDPFSFYHRLLDTTGQERRVVVAGDGQRSEEGMVVGLRGYFIDLTESVTREIRENSDRNIAAARATQEVIDHARGVLMAVYGIDADAAWMLLRWASQNTNTKLRDLARALVQAVPAAPGATQENLRARVERLLCPPDGPQSVPPLPPVG